MGFYIFQYFIKEGESEATLQYTMECSEIANSDLNELKKEFEHFSRECFRFSANEPLPQLQIITNPVQYISYSLVSGSFCDYVICCDKEDAHKIPR